MRPSVMGIFAEDAAAFDDAPACGFEGGIDVLGSGFGLVHGNDLQSCGRRLR